MQNQLNFVIVNTSTTSPSSVLLQPSLCHQKKILLFRNLLVRTCSSPLHLWSSSIDWKRRTDLKKSKGRKFKLEVGKDRKAAHIHKRSGLMSSKLGGMTESRNHATSTKQWVAFKYISKLVAAKICYSTHYDQELLTFAEMLRYYACPLVNTMFYDSTFSIQLVRQWCHMFRVLAVALLPKPLNHNRILLCSPPFKNILHLPNSRMTPIPTLTGGGGMGNVVILIV